MPRGGEACEFQIANAFSELNLGFWAYHSRLFRVDSSVTFW